METSKNTYIRNFVMIQLVNLDQLQNIAFWIIVFLAIGIFAYYFTLSLQKPKMTPSCLYSDNLERNSKQRLKTEENIQREEIILQHQRESVIQYSQQRIKTQEDNNENYKSHEILDDSQL